MACSACSQQLPEGARFCPFCGRQVVTVSNEERRLVTVLFADIVGYTGLVEFLDPERAKRLLDDAFERLIADIAAFGGTVDKVLGDGVLALFGAPVAHEDDPDRAVRAALQMHASLAEFVREHQELEQPVRLRVGVNTGEVLFGRLGGTDNYTVMGDVVNVASRLETLAPPGGTYVGDSTATLTSRAILLDPVDDVDVRGREQREMVWSVVGIARQRFGLGVDQDTPFVGRARELEQLQNMLGAAENGATTVVAISGEPGSGKTRLVAETLETVGSKTTVLAGQCAPYGQTNAWAPIANSMFGRVDPATTTSAPRLREFSIHRAVANFGFDVDDPLLEWVVDAVLHIAGHPSRFDHMPLTQSRDTLFRLIAEALRRRASTGPLVLFVDDLQWADSLLIELLRRIVRSLADLPFLLVTAQRDSDHHAWPPDFDDVDELRIRLGPLSADEATELTEAIIGGSTDPLLASRLYERSGGNPLFVTELAGLAGSSGESVELPSSLRVLIAARLDRLSPIARSIIDNAAVLGSNGPVSSLEVFAREVGQPFSADALAVLEAEGLLELLGARWWRFRSDVVREVAYQTLTKVDRAERHAGVARVMAATPGTPLDQTANHAARAAELNREIGPLASLPADLPERAVVFLERAAQRSLEVGAFRQARRHADRALAFEPEDDSLRRRLLLARSTAATELREYELVGDDLQQILESAVAAGDRRDEGTVRRLLGVRAHGVGDFATAQSELDHSIAIFRDLGDDGELAVSLADRGFVEIFGGSLTHAERLLDESEHLADKLDAPRSKAWAHEHKALVAFLSGDTALAARRIQTATELFEELGDRGGMSWARALTAYLAFYERRLDDAEALAHEARRESLQLGERWGPAMMDTLLSSIRLWTGEFDEAERLARRSLQMFRELGDRFGTVQSLAPHVRSLVALGRRAEAERGIEEAMALSETSGNLAFPTMVAAGAAVHLGIGDRAVVIADRAVSMVTDMEANGSEARTALALALCQAGRADEALAQIVLADADLPYTRCVHALALALIADGDRALAEAEWVSDDSSGATYLDRIIAGVAAASAHALGGNPDAAAERARALRSVADEAGDTIGSALAEDVAARLGLEKTSSRRADLGVGWTRVLDDLQWSAEPASL